MYKFILSFVCLCFSFSLLAQSSRWAVEVGAFAERVPLAYFKKLNKKVYETLDVNEIFRYYVDVSDQATGEVLRAEAKAAGCPYARVIDFEYQRQICANQCGYTPPTPTVPSANNNRFPSPQLPKRTPADVNISTYETLQKEDSLLRLKWLFFDFNKSAITRTAKIELEQVAEVLQKYPSYTVELYAHTDAKGSVEYNEKLSARRADAAAQELARLGIASSRISSREFGKSNPIAANEINDDDTPEGRQFNRRVEIQIFDQQGNIVNIVDQTQVPNNLKIGQANNTNSNTNNNGSNNQNNNSATNPNNNPLNKNTTINPTPAPTPKPKKKKIINNHYDK